MEMPLDKYFKGKGAEVMGSMKKEYGAKKGKSVFYATVNKMKNSKSPKVKKQKGGENPMEGNSMPFQLGDPSGRFVPDSRAMGASTFKKGK
jgi:hypothetical protein